MLLRINYPEVSADRYLPHLTPALVQDLSALARQVSHLRFVHINSTSTGGGVAEILQSLVPLMNALGVATERVVINPPPHFFEITKGLHNFLQGAEGHFPKEELEYYLSIIAQVADEIRSKSLEADVWFLHDPQLLPLAQILPKQSNETRLWVCHIDLTAPNQSVMDTLLPLTKSYDGLIFSLESYAPAGLDENLPVYIVPPAIDPLTEKNVPLDTAQALRIVGDMGIDPQRPLITQVSRFDVWKDPWGVIDAYRLARESIPGLQLALLGLSQAIDDPEALDVVNSVTQHAGEDPDIHLYFCASGLAESIDKIVNAFQVASQVVIQKSVREGFGLTVTEAMWKARPVIGGDVGGIRIQVQDGVNGYLVSSPEHCAQRIVQLINDPGLRTRIGDAARASVCRRFLLPRLAVEYLQAAIASGPGLSSRLGASGKGFQELELLSLGA